MGASVCASRPNAPSIHNGLTPLESTASASIDRSADRSIDDMSIQGCYLHWAVRSMRGIMHAFGQSIDQVRPSPRLECPTMAQRTSPILIILCFV